MLFHNRILKKFPRHQGAAEEACRHILNVHLSTVHSMLSATSSPKHRKAIIKCLTAMVTIGVSIQREVLNHLSLHTQVLETLLQHNKPTDADNVRTCFVRFILAFLIEGNVSIIRELLDKRGVLTSVFSGLIYDSHELVQLVLGTVKKYVLENLKISKTTKLHVFSTPVVQSLVSLYNWKGPNNWTADPKKSKINLPVNSTEKEVIFLSFQNFKISKWKLCYSQLYTATLSLKHYFHLDNHWRFTRISPDSIDINQVRRCIL